MTDTTIERVSVYLVTYGCYSDMHPVAICSTLAKAEAVSALDRDGQVFTMEIDRYFDLRTAGYSLWIVTFSEDDGSLVEIVGLTLVVDRPMHCGRWHDITGRRLIYVADIRARSQDEALKIATDERAKFLAATL